MQVYNPVVATAYPERMLNEYQKSVTARDFLIKGLTIPSTLLLSDVSFLGGAPGEDFTQAQVTGYGIELMGLLLVLLGSTLLGLSYRRFNVVPALALGCL